MPWPFNGGQEEYPNQTDPAALGQGPQTDVGSPPPFTGGQSPGVSYRVTVVYSDEVKNFEGVWSPRAFSQTVTVTGPVQGVGNVGGVLGVLAPNPVPTFLVGWPYACSSRTDYRNCEGKITAIVRADGQPDTGGNPAGGTAPTYAPNPARGNRQPTTPGLDPNLLPAPSTPDYPNWSPDSGNRWPETPATSPPDTQPFPPAAPNNPAAAPVGFTPTAPTTAPNTPTNPNAPPGPPDLDPNAPPRPAPDLATDPDTPAPAGNLAPVNQPDVNEHGEPFNGWIINGQKQYGNAPMTWGGNPITNSAASVTRPEQEQVTLHTPFNVPPVLPVPIPVGQRPPVNTPSAPRLTSNPADNPNVQYVEQPVIQTPPEGPKGTCFYEFQRVADIQRKATDTQERASNAVSGFPGLYGLAIESRVKLGETYDNTQEIKRRIRPEDFPITVPAQIANPNTGIRVIESLAELGVWIVEQLDGVVGKWPMEVPVPGASTALAVPNIAEGMAEMFGMRISQQVTAAQILNTSSRTLAQAGSATQQAAQAQMIAKANAEFLGYESRPTAVDMPLTYTPGHDPGEGLLEESTAKIRGWENTDGTDLKQILSDLMHAAQIIKAVYWRKLDATGDFQAQIDEQIRGKSAWLDELGQRPSPQQADDWEQYLRDVEAGFTARTNDATPYGRHPDEGPKIRDVTPDPDADAPTP